MKFTEYIRKTRDNRRGYKWGRGWSTEVDTNGTISLYHYGTLILKWNGKKIIYFRLGSMSDCQGINKCLPQDMWAGSWDYRYGHFTKKINGVDINTVDCITDNAGTHDSFLCNINGKPTEIKKLNVKIKLKYGKFFHINHNDNALIRVISKRKRPFKYKRGVVLWKCDTMKGIFPLVSSTDGLEVYKCVRLKTEESPEDFVNRCMVKIV